MAWTLKAESYQEKRATYEPDLAEVRRAILLLADPAQSMFLQSFPSKKWELIRASDAEGICNFVKEVNDGRSTFFAINPCGPLTGPAKDSDILARRWLFIDVDRNKTLQPEDPATEQEHNDARELAHEILTYLGEVGFPAPIQIDSGNGFHLYYRIDMPNDPYSKSLIRETLNLLDATFSDARGDVGAECHDARRLSRLPGTWSRRGVDSKSRPYRMCKILHAPEEPEVVPLELLQKLANMETKINGPVQPIIPEPVKKNGLVLTAGGDRDKAYGRRALELECGKVAAAPVGTRNNQLFKSSAALYQLVAGGALEGMEVRNKLFAAALQCGLDKDEGGDKKIIETIDNGKKHGMEQPRKAPEQAAPVGVNGEHKPEVKATDKLIVFASEIEPTDMRWLWQGRIPLDCMTTFAGPGGVGKTTVLTDIVARVTTGAGWPDGASGNAPGRVLYISGEDSPSTTLVPRLIAAGGDRSRVAYLKPEVLGQFSLAKLDILDAAVDQLGELPMLVCVDPPTSFLAGCDDHKNSELRQLLTPVSEWAAKKKVAMVFITHINKSAASNDAMARIIGSVAWGNAVRATHMFARDDENDGTAIFQGVKVTGAAPRRALSYKIVGVDPTKTDGPSRIEWLGEVDTTIQEAMQGQSKLKTRRQNASEWLIERFREKLEWESEELWRAAKEDHISRNALFEAKSDLLMPKARKHTNQAGHTSWIWWVPPDWPAFGDERPKQKSSEDEQSF